MIKNVNNRGFTLIEIIVVLIVLAVIATWGIASFQKYTQRAKLMAAKSAMLENANYLENFYSKYYRYNNRAESGSTCLWPVLPKTKIPGFNIAFSTSAPVSCQTQSYIIYAIPDEQSQNKRSSYLKMDENKNIALCVSQGTGNKDMDECDVF
ncbi:MAG: prepilin-type N-terminal cleavage/methylation domain-containing protein [Neisseriaceae bacterium]|nr:MAG: prepilin-type N-terminal cleavage/methylation domain-containing protein [Neisseriaceae bacterium]